MDREVAKKWIEALTSGAYKKAKKALKRHHHGEDRHCCLGVLIEICPLDSARFTKHNVNDNELGRCIPTVRGELATLESPVREWAGLTAEEIDELIEMNDNSRGWDRVIKYVKDRADWEQDDEPARR